MPQLEPPAQAERFDEQIRFVNALGTPLGNVKYTLKLDDGSMVSGMTDAEGRTKRVVTAQPVAVIEATLQPRELESCCSAHAEALADEVGPLTFPVDGVSTNSTDVGVSEKQVGTPKGKSRSLTSGEISMVRLVFKDSLNYAAVRVYNGEYLWFGLQPDDTAMTPNGKMYFNAKYFKEDFSVQSAEQKHWFVHEMAHVWQYQLGYPVKLRGAIRLGLSYEYELDETKRLADFNMEAQGDVIADYFALKHLRRPDVMRQQQYAASLPVYESVTLAGFLAAPASRSNLPGGE